MSNKSRLESTRGVSKSFKIRLKILLSLGRTRYTVPTRWFASKSLGKYVLYHRKHNPNELRQLRIYKLNNTRSRENSRDHGYSHRRFRCILVASWSPPFGSLSVRNCKCKKILWRPDGAHGGCLCSSSFCRSTTISVCRV